MTNCNIDVIRCSAWIVKIAAERIKGELTAVPAATIEKAGWIACDRAREHETADRVGHTSRARRREDKMAERKIVERIEDSIISRAEHANAVLRAIVDSQPLPICS